MLEGRRFTLTQPVHVEDSDDVVEFVVAAEGQRLPDCALSRLAVPDQTVHAVTAQNAENIS